MDERETQIFAAIIIALIVVGAIITYFAISVIRHQKKVVALQIKNANAEITALEKDRARIAVDLHDELAPMLVAVKLKINSFDLTDEGDQLQLEKTNHTVDEIAQRMREISFDLMPNTLQRKGLLMAVKEFASFINQNNGLQIKLNLTEQSLQLNEQKQINIYRIIQEIVHNTIKHANADELIVEIKRKKNEIILSTVDNGIGFNYDENLKNNTGLGLRSLLNRINLLNGDFNIESNIRKGTAYQITIPLENE